MGPSLSGAGLFMQNDRGKNLTLSRPSVSCLEGVSSHLVDSKKTKNMSPVFGRVTKFKLNFLITVLNIEVMQCDDRLAFRSHPNSV